MLDPHERTLLRDALRPPPGYTLDRALLTTFSLDLTVLLTVPVSFTVFQLQDRRGPLAADPLALLEALRRYARRVTVFCQAGRTYLPRRGQLLLAYLETSVFEVTAPRGGVFHPKLSVLRYVAEHSDEDGASAGVFYRVLCSSRNLTFDRSWDTLLTLEGTVADHRKRAFSRNHPLANLVRALPEWVENKPAAGTLDHVRTVADELLRADFETPDGFDDFAFCPLGMEGAEVWPVCGYSRTLTVAPFVHDGFVRRLTSDGGEHQLVSRIETLDGLSLESLERLSSAWYMNPAADPATAEEESGGFSAVADKSPEGDSSPASSVPSESPEELTNSNSDEAADGGPLELVPAWQLSGLHAKLFVADDGARAHVWTGSANATEAAFERNVEFLVRLTGRRNRCGIDAFLRPADDGHGGRSGGRDRATGFADLLLRYERTTPPETDATRQLLEDRLEAMRTLLATAGMRACAESLADRPSCYRLAVSRSADTPLSWVAGVRGICHPVTVAPSAAARLPDPVVGKVAAFESLSFEGLTSFFAFHLSAREGQVEQSCTFVLNLPLSGAPADREGRILLSLLRNRAQLLRYLLLLLADDDEAAARLAEAFEESPTRGGSGRDGGFGLPLLEPLLRALDRQPERIDQIARLIEDLQQTPEGRELVSDDFLSVWQSICLAVNLGRS